MKHEIESLLNLAYIYMNYGKTKRAIDYLLIAYRLDPNNIQIKKMKIAAFKDIGAFPQSLELIAELENNPDMTETDMATLKLMKSLCLKGMGNTEEAKNVFAAYVEERKTLATKEYIEKHHAHLSNLSDIEENGESPYNTNSGDTDQKYA